MKIESTFIPNPSECISKSSGASSPSIFLEIHLFGSGIYLYLKNTSKDDRQIYSIMYGSLTRKGASNEFGAALSPLSAGAPFETIIHNAIHLSYIPIYQP